MRLQDTKPIHKTQLLTGKGYVCMCVTWTLQFCNSRTYITANLWLALCIWFTWLKFSKKYILKLKEKQISNYCKYIKSRVFIPLPTSLLFPCCFCIYNIHSQWAPLTPVWLQGHRHSALLYGKRLLLSSKQEIIRPFSFSLIAF